MIVQSKGIENALKMREMWELDPHTGASFECDGNNNTITVRVHPWNGMYYEQEISTYKFNEDGSYTVHNHQ